MRSIHIITICTTALALSSALAAQQFGAEETISTSVKWVQAVVAEDFDGDGDADVVSASSLDTKIAIYENLGGDAFGPQIFLATATAYDLHAGDLDGDGDLDLVGAGNLAFTIENLGGGAFGPLIYGVSAKASFPVDIDGDGDVDLITGSSEINWQENLGGGSFGSIQTISSSVDWTRSVFSMDLDGDGDADVLSASSGDDKIAWYENLGGGAFGVQQILSTAIRDPWEILAADLDGDGAPEVIAGSDFVPGIGGVTVFMNRGGGSFGPGQTLTGPGNVRSICATDLDGDGDPDLLSAGSSLGWYENLGGGTFGVHVSLPHSGIIETAGAADLDGNGTQDVIAGSFSLGNGFVAWYKNLDGLDLDDDGLLDTEEGSLFGTDPGLFDTDGDGLSDGQELGITYATAPADTDPLVFFEDTDPLSTTDPLLYDTDAGGTSDGNEDVDKNGALDIDEHDPNNAIDDLFQLSVVNLSPGQQATISVSGCRPGSTVIPLLTTAGLTSRLFPIYDQLEISLQNPITQLAGITVNGGGTASTTLNVPPSVSVGSTVYWQAVEVTGGGEAYRPSDAIAEVVL